MAQEHCSPSVQIKNFDEQEGNSNGNLMRLERKEDGNLVGSHLTYIRSCMKDMLCQIWSADVIERQREGHQRANSPVGEMLEEYDNEIPNSHVNIVDISET